MLTHEPDGTLAERGIDFLWHDAILSTRKDAAPNLERFTSQIAEIMRMGGLLLAPGA